MAGRRATITVETPPDRDGRQRFVTEWEVADPPDAHGRARRAQYFRAVVADYVKYWEDAGYTVVVIDHGR